MIPIKASKLIKVYLLILAFSPLTNCASSYKMIEPKSIHYISNNETDGVKLEYKYNLLQNKYEKKEFKSGVKLVAVKISNNSGKDLTFGKDFTLIYENGADVLVLENEKTFKTLKQSPASYLWYLLLTPVNFYTTETNSYGLQEQTSSTPIGLVLGPGLTGGNMIAAGSANKKFKTEMLEHNLYGSDVKNGETIYGLIGIKTNSYDAIRIKLNY